MFCCEICSAKMGYYFSDICNMSRDQISIYTSLSLSYTAFIRKRIAFSECD
jgi:hypothetical protein